GFAAGYEDHRREDKRPTGSLAGGPNRYMASEVKRAHPGILKILSSLRSLLSEPTDHRLLVCAAFFISGLQQALHQTAIQGRSLPALCRGRPTASTLAGALENHAFPTSALQSDEIALRSVV